MKCSIREFKELYPTHSNKDLVELCGISYQTVKNKASQLGLKKNGKIGKEHKPKEDGMEKKTGVESRHDDRVVINWTTKTILTDLGEFGDYSCNFSTHNAIQRYYVNDYEGKGHTSSEVAMKFTFPHAKAVLLYARLHGFTKASPGQTDIEFEEGLTVEDAVAENIQAMKRKTVRQTEIKKWQNVQKDADKWNNFQNSVLYPMEEWVKINLPTWKGKKYKSIKKSPKFAAVLGMSDEHYLKLAWNHEGKITWNRKKAENAIHNACCELISSMHMYGTPEVNHIPSGSDDYHIDGIGKTTTAGTPQGRQTDGDWELDMDTFMRMKIDMYDMFARIAPVVLIPMHGNHNNETSIMMHHFMGLYYEDNKNVTVVKNFAPRVYQQYGKNAFIFQHGKTPNTNKFQREAHKYFMVEAKKQGINLQRTQHFTAFTGDLHHDSYKDLGGVKHFIIPSLAESDSWHQEQGFIGSRKEASLYIFCRQEGRKAVFYS